MELLDKVIRLAFLRIFETADSSREVSRKKSPSKPSAKTEITNKLVVKIGDPVSEDRFDEKAGKWSASIDGIGSSLEEIFELKLEEFKEIVKENKNKKGFVTGPFRIFTILLTAKCSSFSKRKIIKKTSEKLQ